MKLHYDPETDSLYIEMKPEPGAETREVAEGVNVDIDAKGVVVGFDIDFASKRFDLSRLETHLPSGAQDNRRVADRSRWPSSASPPDESRSGARSDFDVAEFPGMISPGRLLEGSLCSLQLGTFSGRTATNLRRISRGRSRLRRARRSHRKSSPGRCRGSPLSTDR